MCLVRDLTLPPYTEENVGLLERINTLICAYHVDISVSKTKGPGNPTCQLLPTSSKRKVKMAWGKQEREKRW
jgi:hypothetical protein